MKKRRDLILILTILIISLVAIIVLKVSSKKNNLKAVVYYKNDIVLEIDLAKLDDDITYYTVKGIMVMLSLPASITKLRLLKKIQHIIYVVSRAIFLRLMKA